MHPNQIPASTPLVVRWMAGVILLAALSACTKNPAEGGEARPMPAIPVTVLEMQPVNIASFVEVMAQTEGARETEVRARVGGVLLKRLYQEGESVKRGQPLFKIDPASYEIAVAEARAKAEQTAREEARLKTLLAAQAISQKDYDDAASANAVAQAALRQAALNLSWTTVTAPVAGTTGRAVRSEGNLITTSDSLLTSIYQLNPIWVRFSLAQSDMDKLPTGRLTAASVTGVELVLQDGRVYPAPGKLNFLASTIDTTLGTQQIRAEFPNTNGQLLPGQFVRARLLTGERKGVFLVPQVAVMQTDKGNVVMVSDAKNKVTPRPIKTAEWRGTDWVVLAGLNPGDKVIVDNLIKLRPGAAVNPHPPAAAPSHATSTATKGE